jgi:hypothetical protein
MNKINYLKKLLSVIGKKEYTEEDLISIFELVLGEEEKQTVFQTGDKVINKEDINDPMLEAIRVMGKTPLKGNSNLVKEEKII